MTIEKHPVTGTSSIACFGSIREDDWNGASLVESLGDALRVSTMTRRSRWMAPFAKAGHPAAALVALVGAAVLLVVAFGTPPALVLRFFAYWFAWIAVPGVLVWRLVAPRWQRPFDVFVVGVCGGYALELVSYVATAAADLRWLFWGHPFLIGGPALLAARRWPPQRVVEPSDRRGPLWHWITAGTAFAVLAATALYYYWGTPWPVTRPLSLTIDLYHQLGWAADATRAMPPTDATVSGLHQPYHWFTYAHLAAAHEISGVSLPWLTFRLYLVPLLLVYAGVLASAGSRLARRPWAGPTPPQ